MRVLVDQDQVLCDWVGRILEWYNEDKRTSFTKDDIKMWDVKMNLGPNSEDFLRSCMRYPEFYRDLQPVEGAIYGMERLIGMGHEVFVVTAVPKCAGIAFHGKHEWLRRNMPFFDLNNFVACHKKYVIKGDILFDDGLHNVGPYVKENVNSYSVILDCPWNRDETVMGYLYDEQRRRVVRVSHWNEFLEAVPKIEETLKGGFVGKI